ncbi:hypothetical protein CJ030_MR1G004774 [Morella rubra]|uniref:Uncharacterized protein n=1 Tax=Morella rubra TaxID=262757 RepID=A0A6A1WHS0_9ROSI|nr:hypothetical protein CJ030_MR1G004774 [Morella rubra]
MEATKQLEASRRQKGQQSHLCRSQKRLCGFLFHLLSLPIGSVVGLLSSRNMVGCIGNLYKSIEDLNVAYQHATFKSSISNKYNSACPSCASRTSYEVQYTAKNHAKAGSASEEVYVKGLVTYMVMDDLSVAPISMIAGIAVLNKCNISEFHVFEERTVGFGIDEVR